MSSPSQLRDVFEARVTSTRNGALHVAFLHLSSRFLSVVTLVWATILLLPRDAASAFLTFDFFLITALLLLQGMPLFIARVFGKFFHSKPLFWESHRPEYFEFKDVHYIKANRLDNNVNLVSFIFALASLLSIAALFVISFTDSPYNLLLNEKNRNLAYALYIFYGLVMVNSLLVIVSTLRHHSFRRKCDGKRSANISDIIQNSLTCYYDEVYKTAMYAGLFEANQLDILEFAYTKLSNDYKRNIRPQLIKAHNKDLISYLYNNQQGIAMCCEYLHSPDVWKQVVAASLPGFWVGEPRIELQVALFWSLRQRTYGAGKDAESALNSIECLGQSWETLPSSKTYPFLINDPNIATNIVDTLVHLLLTPIRPTLLFQLRAFEACCRNLQVLQHMYGGSSPQEARESCQQLQAIIAGNQDASITEVSLQELCRKLFAYVSEKGIWMATKIYAGSALLSLLCYGTGEVAEETVKMLQGPVEEYIDPVSARGDGAKRPYFWLNDMVLVEKMRKKLQMPRYGSWEGVRIRSCDGTELPLEEALALIEAL